MTTQLQYIKGIGPKRAFVLEKSGLQTLSDLLHFFPRKYIDRSNIVSLSDLKKGEDVTVIGKIESASIRRGRKPAFYLIISDGEGFLEAVWFSHAQRYKDIFKVGEWISLSGKVGFYRGYQLVHPDYDRLGDDDLSGVLNTGKIVPIYPGSDEFKKVGLNSYSFRKIFQYLFSSKLSEIIENLPASIREHYQFPERVEGFREMHIPTSLENLKKSIHRFKYEEFFFIQLMLAIQQIYSKKEEPGYSFEKSSERLKSLYHRLPFKMTGAQEQVVKEIRRDMRNPHPMNRLLQGDVGSGKTLVAIMAMLIAIDNDFQTALMVPTEVLAEQHFLNISKILEGLNVKIILLTKSTNAEKRKEIDGLMQSGEPLIAIGTHALIQENVKFKNLGLVIVDEQHRFGVLQRSRLQEKGICPDVLVMTATPIPRTLALTVYGSLEVSILDEMPAGRTAIQTVWRFENKAHDIYAFIREHVKNGEQVYIVYPLVEESEKIDLKSATESYEQLREDEFGAYNSALIHGRLKSDEKERIMRGFAEGKIHILFSTTVIEVGVDVANATIMLIEHAERFGLSQLHQLRGRVGRGKKKSYCILKTPHQVGEVAQKRLKIMTNSTDGFLIAEEDLRIRGWGEFFGTRQHGLPAFRLANPIIDHEILTTSRKDAFQLINEDPHLRLQKNSPTKKHFLENFADRINYINIS